MVFSATPASEKDKKPKKIYFDLNEPPQISKHIEANEPEPPENMSITKQQNIMKMLSIFICCCDCKFFSFFNI